MKLRLPHETLAGAMWLARFTDKVRAHRKGTLHADYRLPFCHPRGVDGHFFRHFGLSKDEALAAVTAAPDDEAVASWFLQRPGVEAATIEAWNRAAPLIGRDGQPGRESFLFMRRRMYGDTPPVALESAFELIYFDETGAVRAC